MAVILRGGVLRAFSRALLLALDAIIISGAFALSLILKFNGARGDEFKLVAEQLFQIAPIIIGVYIVCFLIGGVYSAMWRYAGLAESVRLIAVALAAMVIEIALNFMFTLKIPLDILIISTILICIVALGVRFMGKLLRELGASKSRANVAAQQIGGRVLIVGAGEGGRHAMRLCRQRLGVTGEPVCFVDDDVRKHNMRIDSVPVLGTTDDLPTLVKRRGITELIIAMPGVKGERMERVIEKCRATRLPVRTLAETGEPDGRIRDLTTRDFLSRPDARIDEKAVGAYINDEIVLVAGGGDIGAEICRQALKYMPKRLIIMDIDELRAAEALSSLRILDNDCPVTAVVGSVRERARLDEIMEKFAPKVVFHAATNNNIAMMEESPAEAIKTNIFGTQNLLSAAGEHGVERFIMVSSDKAVNPQSVVGATLRAAEMLVQKTAYDMRAVAVRVGNILGGTASAMSMFEAQIKSGGPVTISDPEVTRYYISANEAAQLLLHVGAMAESGAIYVLNVSDAVRIIDIAHKLIRFYGYTPGVDMPIAVTGLNPGEKLFEELLTREERANMRITVNDRIMIAPPISQNDIMLDMQLEKLRRAAAHNDREAVAALMEAVNTYKPARVTLVG